MKSTEHLTPLKSIKADDLDLDFKKYWFILKRRWLPGTSVFGAVLLLVAVAAVTMRKPSYIAQGKLLIKPDETSTLTGVGAQARKELTPLTMQGNPLKTESEVIVSRPLLKKAITELGIKDEEGNLKSETSIKSELEVKNIGGTDILQVSYKSRDPKEAAALVNKLMELYIENNIQVNQAEVSQARQFIYKQLPETEAAVRNAEAELRQFKEANQVVAIEQEATSAVAVVEKTKAQLADFQTQLDAATAQSAELRQQLGMNPEQALSVSTLSQTPAVQTVLTELQTLENQLAVERGRFRDENPLIVNLRSKQASLRALLQERIRQELGSQQLVLDKDLQAGDLEISLIEKLVTLEGERVNLSSQIASLTKLQATYTQRINALPQLEQVQRELQRKVDAAQATYTTLLTKIQELQAAENQTIGNARIIENASVPKSPAAEKTAKMLPIAGALLGILLAGTVVIILEVRDSSIKTVKEAKELFEYTLLAAIPAFERGKKTKFTDASSEQFVLKIPVRDTPRSPISEVYRMLQANLVFLGSDEQPKVIVVASSVPKEGKTTVAANLAVAVAELKQRVLLVDADMRHPFQHHAWDLTNEVGLSNVIVGQVKLQRTVKEVMPNLDVLPSGVIPPNPVALLKSKGMSSILDYASKNYDFVIIDAPPVVIASDALILGKMTDGILLVARPGVVDSTSAVFAKESLDQSGQNVLGLVVNGVLLENESDSYFYQTKTYSTEEYSLTPEKGLFKVRKTVGRS